MKFASYVIYIGMIFLLVSCKVDNLENTKAKHSKIRPDKHSLETIDSRKEIQTDTSKSTVDEEGSLLSRRDPNTVSKPEKSFSANLDLESASNKKSPAEQVSKMQKGKLAFKQKTFDFGFIEMGEEVDHSFYFTNVGSKELNISNATASCGCTTPSYPFIPIEPGEQGKIDVHFSSKGRLGSQQAEVTIFNDGEESVYKLFLKGIVRAPIAKEESRDSTGIN